MKSHWLGLTEYSQCVTLQKDKVESVLEGRDTEVVYGTEHQSVITLGRRAVAEDEILHAGAPVVRAERGGLATLHAPGQLVIYPIVNVRERDLGAREWVDFLLSVSRVTLENCGFRDLVQGEDAVYSEVGKIVSVGIRIDRGVSFHGLSINVSNDLEMFSMIRACGMAKRPIDRLARVVPGATPEWLFEQWMTNFRGVGALKSDSAQVQAFQ